MTDDELQGKFESGKNVGGDNPDAQAYHKVFRALGKEPFQLHPDFAIRVLNRFESARSSESKDMVWLAVGIFLCIGAYVVAVVLTDFEISLPGFDFLKSYAGLFVFGAVFVMALQWLDRKFIRRSLHLH